MNVENIKKLMDGMRTRAVPTLGFDMGEWLGSLYGVREDNEGHVCNTTACGAGWTVAIFDGVPELERLSTSSMQFEGSLENGCYARAAEILGLTSRQADRLFTDHTSHTVTTEDFIATCQVLLDTGKVFWPTLGEDERDWDETSYLAEDESIHDDGDDED